MPLPLLTIPIALTAASALAQVGSKLQARHKIREAQVQLESRREEHSEVMQLHRRRQDAARTALNEYGVAPPLSPDIWEESALLIEGTPPADPGPLWRQWLRALIFWNQPRSILERGAGSKTRIIAPKAVSVFASIGYRTNSTMVARLIQPVSAYLPKVALFGSRSVAAGGGSGTALFGRFALMGFSVAAAAIGPILTAVSIALDVRKVRKARRELREASERMGILEGRAARLTLELEKKAAEPMAMSVARGEDDASGD